MRYKTSISQVANESTAFNHMVDHDVTWGYLRVPYIDRLSMNYAQYLIFEGLEKCYHLSKASTYEQWHALLSSGEERFCEPFYTDVFLHRGLEKAANPPPMYIDLLGELDDEDREVVVGWPFYDDPDRGPVSMWEWVHRDEIPGEFVAGARTAYHRQWAYTFWNLSRLESAGLLSDPSISARGPLDEDDLGEYRTPERLRNLENSQKCRAKVWYKGGSGWWSAEDQTKVVWPQPPKRVRPVYYQPRSIAEAKEILTELHQGQELGAEKK